jgi:hypothetical protein
MSDEINGFNPEYDDKKKEDLIYLRSLYTNSFNLKFVVFL